MLYVLPFSVPEIIPRGLQQTISHRGKQSCCHTRENPTIQSSPPILQLQETPPALSEELEF